MSFAGFAFYIAVRCGFDKHLYLTSCLNGHNHNTCIRLPQTGCTARKMALFIIIIEDRQTRDKLSTSWRCHGNHHNFRLKFMISVYGIPAPNCPSLVFARKTCTPYYSKAGKITKLSSRRSSAADR